MNTYPTMRRLFQYILAAMLFVGCSSSGSSDKDAETVDDQRAEPVRVMEVAYADIARSATYTANLQAYREVYLAPATPGRISKIFVEPGNRVTEGQVVVEMDQTQLHQALVQMSSIETDYRRIDTLRKVGSVSQQQYDQISTQFDLIRSNVAFLRENTRLVAPFSGKVSGKYFENGEMFSGAPNTAVGKAAILSLVQTSRLKALVNVAERFYPNAKQGMTVMIQSDLYPDQVFPGTVSAIYPVIDPATRTFRIEITVPNQQEKLIPGMFARAVLELDKVQAFVAPSLAIMKLQGSNERFVFIEEDGRAKRVVVELGDRYNEMVELISADIKAGDNLIVAGQSRLLDGTPVSVIR